MFTQLELINLELACNLAIKDCKTSLMKIDPDRANGEISIFEELIKKIEKYKQ